MITDTTELKVALRSLQIMETALQSLREQLAAANPALFETTSKSYAKRIGDLQSEIAVYLHSHPSDISQLLQPIELAGTAEK